jgi:glycosyltransferase involved in cell wall biosynthesis
MTRATVHLCFLIRQLNEGGAQRQLVELVKGLDPSKYAITIVSFYSGGRFSADVAQLPHVTHLSMAKHRRWEVAGFSYRLISTIRRLRPRVLHGYLPIANVLCITLKPFLPGTRVVWGIRASIMDWAQYDWFDRSLFQLQRRLARFVDLIIVNSHAGRDYHLSRGFPAEKMIVIPNGIDTGIFVPNPEERKRVRLEWGVADGEKLIGLVARLDPMKDHPTFLRAAALLSGVQDRLRFACIGDGRPEYRKELLELTQQLGLSERVIWERWRTDIPSVHNAFDIFTLPSYFGEGFPNVVGEAMACKVPCVVSDVGDSAFVVGDTGVVVPPQNPDALADGWKRMLARLEDEGDQLGQKARSRVVHEFNRDMLAKRTSEALENVL